MATIATAITMNDSAITTITQNIGSLGFICSARKTIEFVLIARFAIADCRFGSSIKTAIGNQTIGNSSSLSVVSWSRLNPAGQFSLALLFLIRFLAGVDCGRDCAGLASRSLTSSARHFDATLARKLCE